MYYHAHLLRTESISTEGAVQQAAKLPAAFKWKIFLVIPRRFLRFPVTSHYSTAHFENQVLLTTGETHTNIQYLQKKKYTQVIYNESFKMNIMLSLNIFCVISASIEFQTNLAKINNQAITKFSQIYKTNRHQPHYKLTRQHC